jgi:hypothetical protein
MRRFRPLLPIEEPSPDATQPEWKRPLLLVELDDDGYQFADKIGVFDMTQPQLHLLDQKLGFVARLALPHVAAKNIFVDPETNKDPEYLYGTYIFTGAFELDTKLRVRVKVPGTPTTGRVKLLKDELSECWIVMPGTVVDLDINAANHLSLYAGPAEVRNDRLVMLPKANLAAAWYTQQRATFSEDARGILMDVQLGMMLSGVLDAAGYTRVGTVVTSRSWDFSPGGGRTYIATEYQELDE